MKCSNCRKEFDVGPGICILEGKDFADTLVAKFPTQAMPFWLKWSAEVHARLVELWLIGREGEKLPETE